ncbi:MAG: SDR family NAD(P)-dependent oxidoreductase [Paludibacteraceae bacterium]|nr:SDR family NAD(P)-dependent oxidoreductase [Paludibacteraceae bacterium]
MKKSEVIYKNQNFALVTGASSGIGLMYATELASKGKKLILVSNQEKEIAETAEQLTQKYNIETIALYRNLAQENAAEELFLYCKERNLIVDILINNAGIFFFNEFVKTDIKRIELMLSLHVVTVTKLCRLFGEEMKNQQSGYILNMSSMSAWMTMPGIQTYNATKAYILNFSRSLHYEMKPYKVGVTAICPGAIDTGLYGLSDNLRKLAVAIGVSMKPQKLVQIALKKMLKKKKQVLPGAINHLFVPIIKHLPDWFVLYVIKNLKQFQK